ncbi:MAG: glycoside hydrolase family 32 protein [Ancrocorticia sp.]
MTTVTIKRPRDRYRPAYHFTPPTGWMNDPNGLAQIDGVYHMYYQSNPYGPQHNRIHWGHAVSTDLVHWEDRPLALVPLDEGPDMEGCWSGVLVKSDDGPVFVYSGRNPLERYTQTCCLAWPTEQDRLDRFEQDPSNPMISDPPAGVDVTELRDHCVWRDGDTWHQVMGAGLSAKEGAEVSDKQGAILHFISPDLRTWEFAGIMLEGSQVQAGEAGLGTTWECPDIFDVPGAPGVEGASVPGKSVFSWSAWDEGVTLHTAYILGTRGAQAFVPRTSARFVDLGLRHFYAPQTIRLDDGRRLQFGWSQEGLEELTVPEADWFGVMSLPRELWAEGNALLTRPVAEVDQLRTGEPETVALSGGTRTVLETHSVQTDTVGTVVLAPGGELTIDVLATPDDSASSERTRIRLTRSADPAEVTLSVDRSESRSSKRLPRYDAKFLSGEIPTDESGTVELRILVDHSIIEIYANGRPLTARAYPVALDANSIVVETNEGATVSNLSTWEMAAAEQSERFFVIDPR